MVLHAAIATGSATDFTATGTWGDCYVGLGITQTTTQTLTTSYGYNVANSITPGAMTIDGMGVNLSVRTGTTGTMTVSLYNNTDSVLVSGTEVTINCSDLPVAATANINGGWVFFKFAAPVTLEAAHYYCPQAKTSSSSQVGLFALSTNKEWSCYLRTTTQTAIAAGDDFIIAKEYTSAGNSTNAIVTMNNTNTTDFGSTPTAANSLITPGISICSGGTLSFGVTASTAYSLKMSNSIIVYSGGILTMGIADTSGTANAAVTTTDTTLVDTRLAMTANYYVGATITCNAKTMTVTSNTATTFTGTSWSSGGNPGNGYAWTSTGIAMPRNSSAYIQFDCGANVDYGLVIRNLGTFVSQGLSRTAGKSFVSTLASASVTQKTSTAISATASSPGVFTWASNTLANGDTIQFSNVRTITGISAFTTYYIVNNATDGAGKFRISLTKGGADINTTGSGSSTLVGWATSDVDLDVVNDTGWLDNDVVAIASTTRTYTECEQSTLNGNAAAALLTFDDAMVYGHDGVTPTQAEVILLTRNVKIYGASAALQAYIDIKETSVVNCNWTEFYWLGSATANKRGIDTACTTGTQSFQYSSLHHFVVASSRGLNMSGASGTGLTFSNNVTYSIANNHLVNVANSGSSIFDTNVFMRSSDAYTVMVEFADIGSTMTNITVVGCASLSVAFNWSEGTAAPLPFGTTNNIIVHSCNGLGINISALSTISLPIISNLTVYRNASYGINLAAINVKIDTFTLFGNSTANIYLNNGCYNCYFVSGVANGDTTFSTANTVFTNGGAFPTNIYFINCDFDTVSGIKTAHTNYNFKAGNSTSGGLYYLLNCKINGTLGPVDPASLYQYQSSIGFQKYNRSAGDHRTYKQQGTITPDTTTGRYRTASPSQKLTVTTAASSTNKLESGIKKVAFTSGSTGTVSVWVRESVTGDGTDYTGNRARLVLKRNDAMGVTADTVLATATSASEGAFEQLTGSITSGMTTDDGVLEFVVDCDYGSTLGWINVDDWTTS